jgi:ABC-type sugar transport system substrate-binding protein
MRIVRHAVLAVLSAVLVLAAAGGARADGLPVIRVGILTSTTDAPLWLADRNGYFKDEGLAVQFLTFTSGETMIAPLSTANSTSAAALRRRASTTRLPAEPICVSWPTSAAIRRATASIR